MRSQSSRKERRRLDSDPDKMSLLFYCCSRERGEKSLFRPTTSVTTGVQGAMSWPGGKGPTRLSVARIAGKSDDFTHCRITYFQFNLLSLAGPARSAQGRSNEKPLFFLGRTKTGGERRRARERNGGMNGEKDRAEKVNRTRAKRRTRCVGTIRRRERE